MSELGYPLIADHGVIGDLQTAALVSTSGRIDWYCCPRFDSPSVFASLLDAARGGGFQIAPEPMDTVVIRQLYIPDTAVLVTRFMAPTGVGEVVDFMPVAGRESHRSTPAGPGGPGHPGRDAVSPRMCAALRLRSPNPPRGSRGAWCGLPRRQSEPHPARHGAPPATGRRRRCLAVAASRRSQRVRARVRHERPADAVLTRGARAALPRHHALLAVLAPGLDLSRAVAGDGRALGHDPQAHDVRALGCAGRGADRGPAGAGRRRAQLGLPLHLGARRLVLGRRALRSGLRR